MPTDRSDICLRNYCRQGHTAGLVWLGENSFAAKEQHCSRCGATFQSHEEKMGDVNIAVELLSDAEDDVFDTAIIASTDSDLTPPVTAV